MHPRFLTVLPLLLAPLAAHAETRLPTVACHVSYGGETQILRATPTHQPYAVAPVAIGSYFLFRIVFEHPERKLSAVKLYTYADRTEDAVPIHVAHFPFPAHAESRQRRFGFTGQQFVFESMRDGELQYWCEFERTPRRTARR